MLANIISYCHCQHSVAVNQQQVFPILLTREITVHSPDVISVDHSTFKGQPCYSLPIELTHPLPISHVFT
jgi:hypothetical protein